MTKLLIVGLTASVTGLSMLHSAILTAGGIIIFSLLVIHAVETEYH